MLGWLTRMFHLLPPQHDPRLDDLDRRSKTATSLVVRALPKRVVKEFTYAERVALGLSPERRNVPR